MTRKDALALLDLFRLDRSPVPPLNTLAMARLFVAAASGRAVVGSAFRRWRQGIPD